MKRLIIASLLISPALYAETFMGLTIEPEVEEDSYDRDLYEHWIDEAGDGQNTREEVLEAEQIAPNLWLGPYTGKLFTQASDIDIDHMIPLKEAHISGAHAWSPEKKREYANDMSNPQHLIAVEDGANQSKGPKDPASWMPPNRSYWCQYLTDWIQVKLNYSLSVDEDERDSLETGFAVCGLYRIRDAIGGRH